MNDDETRQPPHGGACRPAIGRHNPDCTFCHCEASWYAGDEVWVCARCASAIIAATAWSEGWV